MKNIVIHSTGVIFGFRVIENDFDVNYTLLKKRSYPRGKRTQK